MQKTFKRLAVILLAIVATVCVAFSLTACGETVTDYVVTVVYPDGTAVNGTTDGVNPLDPSVKAVTVQICLVDGGCYDTQTLDANGKATLKAPSYQLKEGEKFKLQVNNVPEGYKCTIESATERTYYSSTNYVTEPGKYTITLEAV